MTSPSYADFVDVNCKLVLTSPVGHFLVEATHGQLCAGCCYNVDKSCGRKPAQNQTAATPSVPKRQEFNETVREEAARRGVPLSQVRRERSA